MYTISIYNNKGGVGKTTITGILGAYLAIKGKNVLMVDADPQGNLSTQFIKDFDTELVDFLKDDSYQEDVGKVIYSTIYENLYICPTKAFNRDAGLANWINSESTKTANQDIFDFFIEQVSKLNISSENGELKKFDYVIYDVHPADSEMKQKIVLSSNEVIPVLQVAKSSLDGFTEFYNSFKALTKRRKTTIFEKIVFNMIDKRTTVTKALMPLIENLNFQKYFFPRDEAFRKAETKACSVFEFDIKEDTVTAIESLANDILNK